MYVQVKNIFYLCAIEQLLQKELVEKDVMISCLYMYVVYHISQVKDMQYYLQRVRITEIMTIMAHIVI